MSAAIFTIGYERGSLPQVVAALQAAKIDTLVDVRAIANSRRAGFSKGVLSASVEAAGLRYRHVKALGTPKPGREASRRGDLETFERIVNGALDEPAAQLALSELSEMAGAERVCLLCLEHDPTLCHRRHVVGRGGAASITHLAPAMDGP
ncbi:MAG: DUF488 family protein [Alphaproteobacteria bacterium]|nr:DUF488 family protein [Alphaproteobacteria bacterium]